MRYYTEYFWTTQVRKRRKSAAKKAVKNVP